MNVRRQTIVLLWAIALAFGCSSGNSGASLAGVTPSFHGLFPIASGDHAVDCVMCHTDATTFSNFTCLGCHTHEQTATGLVHTSVAAYAYGSAGCYQCHPSPTRQPFNHTGITTNCAFCHDTGASFAALPVAGFSHQATNGADCGKCHVTSSWATGAMPSVLVFDPSRDVTVTGLIPSYASTSIAALTPRVQALPMDMDHSTTTLPTGTMGNCAGCHAGASSGALFPGVLHASLAAQGISQPATCAECHTASVPVGFVGPAATNPARSPASGEMKHDAVEWSNGAPTAVSIVVADCSVCHVSPSGAATVTWATGRSGAAVPRFHSSLQSAKLSEPASCLDCHANTRPKAVLTSSTASVPAKVTFDHQSQGALGECATCHAESASSGFASWSGGRYHLVGSATPSSCLPCHGGERPTSTSGWVNATYATSPFDYGTNSAGITHGDGQDCVVCHAGPGTGAWGGSQNWASGHFPHGPTTVASTTCVACHTSQRPDLQPGTTPATMAALLGFDHSLNGTGDCFGCHQPTVAAGRYVNYDNPTTHTLPGGDWAGAEFYPGATLVSASDSVVTLTELTLTRSGSLVTGFTTATATLYGAMSHVSAGIPAQVSPGPASSPDMTKCWHCHTNVNGAVTSYAGGHFHSALSSYSATPGGAVTPLPQPTGNCADCHSNMRPTGIVEYSGSDLQPMDHAALFASPVSLGGVNVTGVSGLDCSSCHSHPGSTWADGSFHARISSAVPADCTVCHYPLMATSTADVANGTLYAMSHRSPLITVQRCDQCHTTALGNSTTTPVASNLWRTGAFHGSVAVQPSACLDCHSASPPSVATQSSVPYVLASGGTATNSYQWMSHAAGSVVGVDCVVCHSADAKASGAAWSKSTAYHAKVASPGSCQVCHGLTNGNGAVAGTGNNLPFGLTDSSTLTTASADSTTGVPAGTHDQIVHTDINVSAKDCSFCHTQAGPSTVSGVQGKEWAQSKFHTSFSSGAPLVMNTTTGRCSDCHLNVKPGTAFTAQDHSTFTSTSGTEDCSQCHTWPGTGSAASPNWLGGGGPPAFIVVGGFTIPNPPSNPPAIQAGIANLPHPSTASVSCAICHTGGVGGPGAKGYDHASTLIATMCTACHETGSNLVGTVWNGATSASAGAGDTRPITLASVSQQGNQPAPNHFFLDRGSAKVDCYNCHAMPAGVSTTTTGSAYTSAWSFHHPPRATIQNFCYFCHANGTGD